MTVSLNEAEALARKAARGAGYSWGMAEEAGKAVRWLCGRGIDGCAALARLLGAVEGTDLWDWAPRKTDGDWGAHGGTLCPLLTGVALSDAAQVPQDDGGVRMSRVSEAVFLLPFAAAVASRAGTVLTISWNGATAVTDGDRLSLDAPVPPGVADVRLRLGGELGEARARTSRAAPGAGDLATLTAFAARTYAPATEASRLLGAGAGVTDND